MTFTDYNPYIPQSYDDGTNYRIPGLGGEFPFASYQGGQPHQASQLFQGMMDSPTTNGTQDLPPTTGPKKKHVAPPADPEPGEPGMVPRPGLLALATLGAILANNQYRPQDNALDDFLGAYQTGASYGYEQRHSDWERRHKPADPAAPTDPGVTPPSTDPPSTTPSALNASNTPQSFARGIVSGLSKTDAFLHNARADLARFNMQHGGPSGATMSLPAMVAFHWEAPQHGGLSPAQAELGEAYLRAQVLGHLIANTGPADQSRPEQVASLEQLRQAQNRNHDQIVRLHPLVRNGPTPEEAAQYAAYAAAVRRPDNEAAVENRLRSLLIGHLHPRPGMSPFSDLAPREFA